MCRDILLKTGNASAKKNEFKINKGFWIKNKHKYFPVMNRILCETMIAPIGFGQGFI